MRVAVTGGAGFIGSHVVDQLLEAGHDVVVVDMLPPHRDVEARAVDVLDLDGLQQATADCDAVFHLAAVSNVKDVERDPARAVAVNVVGTTNVWEAARRNELRRAVLASTVWVYGAAVGQRGLDERTPMVVDSIGHTYTATKLAAEMVVHSMHDLYGQPFTILRYGIPYGPRMRSDLVIARFVDNALAGRPITIEGSGLQYRNYVYVEDLARAHVLALSDAGENEVFNLEGPEPVSVRRIAEAVQLALDHRVRIVHGPARAGDFTGREVSAERARTRLGWEPRVGFEDGLRRYIEWLVDETGEAAASTMNG
ncbi:MAG TPA: NAD-dependent epimerase/dehydratase family protein [Acidimicrobiia bacterium]|nr:NAD-dependent epimerase/dehydratase family protein [Acidimicrobiia bacterium]